MTKFFKIDEHDKTDKSFVIYNDEITMEVDYDEVDHDTVDRAAKRIVRILNAELARESSAKNIIP